MRVPRRDRRPLAASILTSALSMAAGGGLSIAFPWVIISGGGAASWAGAVSFALLLCFALGTALAGGLIERFGARRVLLAADALGCLAALPAVALACFWPAAAYAAIPLLAASNLGSAASAVVLQARVPDVARLAGTSIERATGFREMALNLGYLGGPAGMVALIDGAGLAAGLGTVALLLAGVWLVDLLLFPRFRTLPRSRAAARPGAERSRAAWRILLADGILARICVFALVSAGFYLSLDEIVAPAYFVAKGLGGEEVAVFLMVSSLAGLGAAALYTAWGARWPARPVLGLAQGLMACGLFLLWLLPPEIGRWLAPALVGFGGGSLWPPMISQVLRRVRRREAGRAIGALGAGTMLAQPLAALAAGPAVDMLGPERVVLVLAGLLLLPILALRGGDWR